MFRSRSLDDVWSPQPTGDGCVAPMISLQVVMEVTLLWVGNRPIPRRPQIRSPMKSKPGSRTKLSWFRDGATRVWARIGGVGEPQVGTQIRSPPPMRIRSAATNEERGIEVLLHPHIRMLETALCVRTFHGWTYIRSTSLST